MYFKSIQTASGMHASNASKSRTEKTLCLSQLLALRGGEESICMGLIIAGVDFAIKEIVTLDGLI